MLKKYIKRGFLYIFKLQKLSNYVSRKHRTRTNWVKISSCVGSNLKSLFIDFQSTREFRSKNSVGGNAVNRCNRYVSYVLKHPPFRTEVE